MFPSVISVWSAAVDLLHFQIAVHLCSKSITAMTKKKKNIGGGWALCWLCWQLQESKCCLSSFSPLRASACPQLYLSTIHLLSMPVAFSCLAKRSVFNNSSSEVLLPASKGPDWKYFKKVQRKVADFLIEIVSFAKCPAVVNECKVITGNELSSCNAGLLHCEEDFFFSP